jgi:hypothetical protein
MHTSGPLRLAADVFRRRASQVAPTTPRCRCDVSISIYSPPGLLLVELFGERHKAVWRVVPRQPQRPKAASALRLPPVPSHGLSRRRCGRSRTQPVTLRIGSGALPQPPAHPWHGLSTRFQSACALVRMQGHARMLQPSSSGVMHAWSTAAYFESSRVYRHVILSKELMARQQSRDACSCPCHSTPFQVREVRHSSPNSRISATGRHRVVSFDNSDRVPSNRISSNLAPSPMTVIGR